MKKLTNLLFGLLSLSALSASAYECPPEIYFYESQKASTAFTKTQTVFTYTVDATAADVYGAIVNFNANSWTDAQTHNGYFPNTWVRKNGNFEVGGVSDMAALTEYVGTTNSPWSNGCYKFLKGHKYQITLTHANGTFTGKIALEGEGGATPEVKGFSTEKDYYINYSACSWFMDGGAEIYVYDGAKNVPAEVVSSGVIKFKPTASGVNGLVYIKRCMPGTSGATSWNELAVAAPVNDTDNLYTINSDFKGISWSVYTVPAAWIISQKVNNWDMTAESSQKMTYDAASQKYTITIDPAQLQSAVDADNGFKIGFGNVFNSANYYGAVGVKKVLGNGIEADTKQGGENFVMPAVATNPVTITLDAKNAKVTATWTASETGGDDIDGPVESTDNLMINLPKMDVNGLTTVEVTLNSTLTEEYCSANWDIVVPEGFTVSDITLNTERCTDHTLVTNTVNGVVKCIIYSAQNTPFVRLPRPLFSFKLKATNAAVGEVAGKLTNIIFNTKPSDGNLNIGKKFGDTPLNINVVKAVKTITATPSAINLAVGGTQAIAVEVGPADASDTTYKMEIVSGESFITLADGVVTAVNAGISVIRITANDGFGATASVDVTIGGKKVTDIALSATSHTMYISETLALKATVTPDDATNLGVIWTSADDNVATVSADGVVTGKGVGTTTIVATAKDGSGVSAECVVTIKAKIPGDADGNDQLNIQDIVILAKAVVGEMTEGMHPENMDLDGDGIYTSTDVTLAVYYLMKLPVVDTSEAQVASNAMVVSSLDANADGSLTMPIYLGGANSAAGVQFDIVLPEGLELDAASKVNAASSANHNMSINRLTDGSYRVVIFSANNFKGNELADLKVKNVGNVDNQVSVGLHNVMYSDGKSLNVVPDAEYDFPVVSSIESVYSDKDARHDVYSQLGVLIAKQADKATVESLPTGIYIVGNKKVAVK